MKFDFPRKIRSGYLIAFLLLLFSYFLSITSLVQLKEQNEVVDQTQEVIAKLSQVDSYLKDAEIAWGAFEITKEKAFLLPLVVSRRKVDTTCSELAKTLGGQSHEGDPMGTLHRLIDGKYLNIGSNVQNLSQDTLTGKSYSATQQKNRLYNDSITTLSTQLISVQNRQLAARLTKADFYHKIVFAIMVGAGTLSILLILYSLITFNIESRAKSQARMQAQGYHDQLEKQIAELNAANRELIELRSLEKFTSTGRIARVIAHEVRNPLTNIDLSVGHLDNQNLSREDKKMFLDIINRNSKRINQLINELLSATKFTELQYETVPVNVLLDDSLKEAMDRASLKKVTIEKLYHADGINVKVDRARMKIALLNLMVNAIESMPPENGKLVLATELSGERLLIHVRDNGEGMDAETLSRIFEPYYTSKSNGNGLGLTNSQNIILNHKGKIQASSVVGKGTEFLIVLQTES